MKEYDMHILRQSLVDLIAVLASGGRKFPKGI